MLRWQGLYAPTFKYERNPECIVCGESVVMEIPATATLTMLMEAMEEDQRLRLKKPSLRVEGGGKKGETLYMRGVLEESYKENLDVALSDLFDHGASLIVTDPGVPSGIKLIVQFSAA